MPRLAPPPGPTMMPPPAPASWPVTSPKRPAVHHPAGPKHTRKPSTTQALTPLPTSYPIPLPPPGTLLAKLRHDKARSLPLLCFLLLGLAALAQLRPLAHAYAPLARLFPDDGPVGMGLDEPAFWVEDGDVVQVPVWHGDKGEVGPEAGQVAAVADGEGGGERVWDTEEFGEMPKDDPSQL